HREQDEGVVGVEGLLHQALHREPLLEKHRRQAGKAEGERHGHAQHEEKEEAAEQDQRRGPGREQAAAHSAASRCFATALGCARPARTIAASHMRSPWKTNQVRPVTGQATWIIHSGRSASSETRFQAKRVNSQPAQRKTKAKRRMKTLAASCSAAVPFAPRVGHTSTSKCEPSRTPIMAPIITIQMKRKRAISSVQIYDGM